MRTTRRTARWTLAACGAAAALLAACASIVDRQAQQAVVDALPRVLGPADRYEVEVRGASRQLDGRIGADEVHAVGIRVRTAGAPAIDRLEADLAGVEVDHKVLTRLAGADLRARLLAADVAAYLATKPALRDVQVGFREGDGVTLSARPVIGGYALPDAARVSLEGSLVASGTQLRLAVTDLRVAGFPAGGVPVRVVERLINPLVDLASLPVPAHIVSAHIAADALMIGIRADRYPAAP